MFGHRAISVVRCWSCRNFPIHSGPHGLMYPSHHIYLPALDFDDFDKATLQMNRGAALRSLGRHDEAMSALNEALEVYLRLT